MVGHSLVRKGKRNKGGKGKGGGREEASIENGVSFMHSESIQRDDAVVLYKFAGMEYTNLFYTSKQTHAQIQRKTRRPEVRRHRY